MKYSLKQILKSITSQLRKLINMFNFSTRNRTIIKKNKNYHKIFQIHTQNSLESFQNSHQNDKIKVIFYNDWGASWDNLSSLALNLHHDERFEVIIIAMCSRVHSIQFYDLGASLALKEFADTLNIPLLDSTNFKHSDSATKAIIGFDTELKPTIFPQDIKAHFCFTTRPYSELRPKDWDSQNLSRFYKLAYTDYGVAMHSLSHHGITAFNFLNLRYYDFVFIATNYHKSFIESKQAEFHQPTYTKVFSVGSGKIEQILQTFSDYKPPKTIHTIAYMPRWSVLEESRNYCTFLYIFPYLLDLAKSKQIHFIFRPHPNMYDHFVNKRKILTQQQWDTIIKELESLPNATLDSNPSLLETFIKADVLISDASSMLVYGFLSGKPTIYTQNQTGGEVNNWALQWLQGCFIANDIQDLSEIITSLRRDYHSTMLPKALIRESILKRNFTFLESGSSEAIKRILLADFMDSIKPKHKGS